MNKLYSLLILPFILTGCNDRPTSNQIQRQQQEQLNLQAVNSVGMPAITRFSEKRMLKDIYELRDKLVPTYTYLYNMNGSIGDKICDSAGYGIPGATQYTNPQSLNWDAGFRYVLPQVDPNGLFSSASSDATWVLCKEPGTGKIMPQYIEPRVIVLTFPKESNK